MTDVIDYMLEEYRVQTLDEKKMAMKEVIQELVLCGLSRAGYFKETMPLESSTILIDSLKT